MNRVILIGRLTRDPELRHTPSNVATTTVTVAVARRTSNQNNGPEADFISVVIWDKSAENVCKYLRKGSQIAVEGRIQTRNYDNNEGKKVYVTEVIATSVQFLDSKSNSGNSDIVNNSNPFEATLKDTFNSETNNDSNSDVFESFGQKITIADNDLPF